MILCKVIMEVKKMTGSETMFAITALTAVMIVATIVLEGDLLLTIKVIGVEIILIVGGGFTFLIKTLEK